MIIGAALVVDELRKGQRLAFRYPASVPSAILNSHPSLLAFHQDYLSLSPDNFAKIFRPKAALFNKIFELTIDDVHYISYPCPCVEKGEENSIDSNNLPSNNDVITLFNVVIATVRESAMKRVLGEEYTRFFNTSSSSSSSTTYVRKDFINNNNISGTDPVAITMGLSNSISILSILTIRKVVESFSKALLMQEKRHRYVSRQVAIMLRTLESYSKLSIQSIQSIQSNNDTNDTDDTTTITSSLRQDNIKQQQVKQQQQQQQQHHQHQHQNNVIIDDNRDLQCMDIMLQQSSLANELRLIFHGLIGGQSLSLTVNNVLHFNMNLKDINDINDNDDSIKPYDTLLLIDESNVIFTLICNMDTSPTDDNNVSSLSRISPLLQKVIRAADPTKSFLDLSMLLEEPLSELYSIANHLQQWGLARIITTITASNCYRVHVNAPIDVDSKVAKSFSATFSNIIKKNDDNNIQTLNKKSSSSFNDIIQSKANNDQLSIARILSCFNGIRTVNEAIEYFPNDYSDYAIDIIVWLLRWRMLCEVHTCLILINPNDTKIDKEKPVITPTKIISKDFTNEQENFTNVDVKEYLPIDEEIIFEKLKGYATGNKTLLEIIWKEGIAEDVIRSIVSKRQDEIEIIDIPNFI